MLLLVSLALANPTLTVSVRGQGPWTGHTNPIYVRPGEPLDHGGPAQLHIEGPRGFSTELPVSLSPPPPRPMPLCDPSPDFPDECDNQPAFTDAGGFTGTAVTSPAWPRPGTYTVTLSSDRPVTAEAIEVEVRDHPLAHYIVLPRGYEITLRSLDPFTGRVDGEYIRRPALYVIAEKDHSEVGIRVSEPVGERCVAALGPNDEDVHWTDGVRMDEGAARTWSWCSEGRVVSLRPTRVSTEDRERLLKGMLGALPSDGAPH